MGAGHDHGGGGGGRRALLAVGVLNLAWLAVELGIAISEGSAALLADSADLVADGLISLVAVFLAGRAWAHRLVAALIAVPALAALRRVADALASPWPATPPDARMLVLAGLGALAVNLACAIILAASRPEGRGARAILAASWGDAAISALVVFAGLMTMQVRSAWIDLALGAALAAIALAAAARAWAGPPEPASA